MSCFVLISTDLSFQRQKRTAASLSSYSPEPIAGPSTIIDVQYSDPDPDPDVGIESDEELSYDYIHAGYDIHNLDIVRAYLFLQRVCFAYNQTN